MIGKYAISAQLENARVVFGVMTDDAEVREHLASIGYDDTAVAYGRSLYDAAVQARETSHDVRGNRLGATDAVNRTRLAVRKALGELSQLLTIEYRNDRDALERLALRPPRRTSSDNSKPSPTRHRIARSQDALIVQARTLYNNLFNDSAILQTLARFGYTNQRLQEQQALVTQLENLDTQQEILIADAKTRVRNQNQSLKELNKWLNRMRSVVRVTKRDYPELLEKLRA
jgi:hypothetical protein